MVRLFFGMIKCLILGVLLAAGLILVALRSDTFIERTVPWAVNLWLAHRPGDPLRVTQLRMGERAISWPGRFTVEGLEIRLGQGSESYALGFDRAEIWDLISLLGRTRGVRSGVHGLWVQIPGGRIDGVELSLLAEASGLELAHGSFRQADLRIGDYQISEISGQLFIYRDQLILDPFQADLYAGQASGTVSVRYGADYQVAMDLRGVDLALVSRVNPAIPVKGRVSGEARIAGAGPRIRGMTGAFDLDSPGEIKAYLLSPFLNYLPSEAAREKIQALMDQGGFVPVRTAQIEVQRLTNRSLQVGVDLFSPEIHLADSQVTVNLDADIGEWLAAVMLVTQGKGRRP